mmetsp:Transcript_25413/g.38204  ORF Transcript_25413/g.38204 Transcript_25413/m.38204 type:complete len:304 (-) Transcript_25413:171-1082(-)
MHPREPQSDKEEQQGAVSFTMKNTNTKTNNKLKLPWAKEEETSLMLLYKECGSDWNRIAEKLKLQGFPERDSTCIQKRKHTIVRRLKRRVESRMNKNFQESLRKTVAKSRSQNKKSAPEDGVNQSTACNGNDFNLHTALLAQRASETMHNYNHSPYLDLNMNLLHAGQTPSLAAGNAAENSIATSAILEYARQILAAGEKPPATSLSQQQLLNINRLLSSANLQASVFTPQQTLNSLLLGDSRHCQSRSYRGIFNNQTGFSATNLTPQQPLWNQLPYALQLSGHHAANIDANSNGRWGQYHQF